MIKLRDYSLVIIKIITNNFEFESVHNEGA